MDFIIRNAKLIDKDNIVDIAIKDGKFIKILPNILDSCTREIDAQGNLVTTPFVESHVHLDDVLSEGVPRFNQSGTLGEAIEIAAARKQIVTKQEIKENAKEVIMWYIANGVLQIRTHTDFAPTFTKYEAILELKKELKDLIDIQIVAFPQEGIYTNKGYDELLEEAVKMGADVIGGLPQAEFTREDGIQSIKYIFDLANRYKKPIDIHTDETGDDQSRFLEVIAKYAIIHEMDGLVTASHTTAMHNYNNDYVAKLIGNIKRANLNIVTNPFSNTILQNRFDGYPKYRGITRVDELLAAGVNVSIGNDNIVDPFGPLGKANMLHAAQLLAYVGHLATNEQLKDLFKMITINGLKTLHNKVTTISEGERADCIVLDAKDEKEAIRLTSECLFVIRNGNIIAETKRANRKVHIKDSEFHVDFKI